MFAKACKDHRVIVITDDYLYDFNDPKRGKEDYKKFIEEAQAAADFLNKHVRMMINCRVRKAMRGEYSGHTVPVGLMLDDDRLFYIPNPDHAKPVKALFKRFRALGGNLAHLRREIVGQPTFPDLPLEILEHTGRINLTKVPGGWTIKSHIGLQEILTNPAYLGHVVFSGRIVKRHAHPAIVDEDDFWFAYYRLAKTDFDGNPIERPAGATKRYKQTTTETIYPALLDGLRNDGTPVITTNVSNQASVYANWNGKTFNYIVIDRSVITPFHHSTRISVSRLDRYFSERLLHRIEEALKRNAAAAEDHGRDAQLEEAYTTANQQLGRQLEEVSEEPQDDQLSPRSVLESSILETKARIAERERIGHEASSEMSGEDLRQHYAALKRLRISKLPTIHERWETMLLGSKQRFIRAATASITLDELREGWLKLTIVWAPLLGADIIDEAYIWIMGGKAWTPEEEEIIRQHYSSAERGWLMEQLPERAWESILTKARLVGAQRSLTVGHQAGKFKDTVPNERLSVNDWRFMQDSVVPPEPILKNRIYWREYVSLPIGANNDGICGPR